MRFALYGGDRRYACACERLRHAGYLSRLCFGPEDCAQADCVVLPAAPDSAEAARIADAAADTALFLVQRGPALAGTRSASLEEDEEYMEAVARLTAEGAIAAILGRRERALYGARCAVYGYGRIGRALFGILRALSANASVVVRGGPSAVRAAADDAPRCGVEEAEEALRGAEYVFNTIPARVLSGAKLAGLNGAELVADLASAPYGFDIMEARAYGVRAERMPGLPGKYCPESAGEQLALAALRAMGKGREG